MEKQKSEIQSTRKDWTCPYWLEGRGGHVDLEPALGSTEQHPTDNRQEKRTLVISRKKLDSANDLNESESEIFSEPPDKSSRWLISEFQLCETLSRELSCA